MIKYLYRYPIKGLSGENLNSFKLTKEVGLALDRTLAIARNAGAFDPNFPVALPKNKFLMLMRDEALATLSTHYDELSHRLLVKQAGNIILDVSLEKVHECKILTDFFKKFLNDESINPEVVSAHGHRFTDISVVSKEKMHAISLINLASIDDFSNTIKQTIEHQRFRSNIYFDGIEPWSELNWVGKEISVGSVRLKVSMRTKRCAATQVNPRTGERDINIPLEIKKHYGHFDMGVYAEVLQSGCVEVGDTIEY